MRADNLTYDDDEDDVKWVDGSTVHGSTDQLGLIAIASKVNVKKRSLDRLRHFRCFATELPVIKSKSFKLDSLGHCGYSPSHASAESSRLSYHHSLIY